MKKRIIRTILGIVTICTLGLSACAKGDGGITGAGKSGDATEASSSQAAVSGASQSQTGENPADGGNNSGSNAQGGAENANHATTLIPLLINRETNALAVGTCEWGGRIVADGTIRRDALEARLRSVNAELTPESGVTDVYVTRSDDTAVSLVIVKEAGGEGEEAVASCNTYVLNPETGKDLRFTDVVTDTDAFLNILRQTADESDLFAAYPTDAALLELVQQNWTLDYDGITVYTQQPDEVQSGRVASLTVYFVENEEVFDTRFVPVPNCYMIRMLPGRQYAPDGLPEKTGILHGAVHGTDAVPQFPVTLFLGEDMYHEDYSKEYPPHYLVQTKGRYQVFVDPPRFDLSSAMVRYDLDGEKLPDGLLMRYGLADKGAPDPMHLRLYDDTFLEEHTITNRYPMRAYAYYATEQGGTFRPEETFWYLEGPEKTAVRPVDTLGYRLYDTETLVSKQITRDMKLAPYRTDGETFFEFAGNGDVFRFEIDGLDENAKLNGTYTFDMLFGT